MKIAYSGRNIAVTTIPNLKFRMVIITLKQNMHVKITETYFWLVSITITIFEF